MFVSLEDKSGLPVGTVDTFGHPAAISVENGQTTAFVTLNAATTNATGLTMDCGVSHQVATIVAVGTGTLAGTLTIEMSLDNVTWVPSGGTVALTAAATVTASQAGRAARYWRASLSGASGTGTVTVNIMANG